VAGNAGVIGGVVGSVVGLTVIGVVVGVFCWKKKRHGGFTKVPWLSTDRTVDPEISNASAERLI
jgi:hypothetical protein